jgi:hypothetical protein
MRNLPLVFSILFIISNNSYSGWFSTTYDECILDNMPGSKNKQVTIEVRNRCEKYPRIAEKKSSIFGTYTASDCVVDNASDTSSQLGAQLIRNSCYYLYPRR